MEWHGIPAEWRDRLALRPVGPSRADAAAAGVTIRWRDVERARLCVQRDLEDLEGDVAMLRHLWCVLDIAMPLVTFAGWSPGAVAFPPDALRAVGHFLLSMAPTQATIARPRMPRYLADPPPGRSRRPADVIRESLRRRRDVMQALQEHIADQRLHVMAQLTGGFARAHIRLHLVARRCEATHELLDRALQE